MFAGIVKVEDKISSCSVPRFVAVAMQLSHAKLLERLAIRLCQSTVLGGVHEFLRTCYGEKSRED